MTEQDTATETEATAEDNPSPKKAKLIAAYSQLFEKETPANIWKFITDPKHVEKWLMPGDIKPEVGHEFVFDAKKAGSWEKTVNIKVLEVIPNEKLTLEWIVKNTPTEVCFTIEPKNNNTRLILEHRANFKGPIGWLMGVSYRGYWPKTISRRLVQYIETNPQI